MFDENQYPTEQCLAEIEKYVGEYEPGKQFGTFPEDILTLLEEMIERCTYASGEWDGEYFRFSTGGWSGCEDFIEALHSGRIGWVRQLFLHKWERGGHWYYKFYKEPTP